jgi:hypothetical protein
MIVDERALPGAADSPYALIVGDSRWISVGAKPEAAKSFEHLIGAGKRCQWPVPVNEPARNSIARFARSENNALRATSRFGEMTRLRQKAEGHI